MDRSKTDFHDATALVHRLRTEILTSLGRDTVDDQCLKVITTNEVCVYPVFGKYFSNIDFRQNTFGLLSTVCYQLPRGKMSPLAVFLQLMSP